MRCGCVCSALIFAELADEDRRAADQEAEGRGEATVIAVLCSKINLLKYSLFFFSFFRPFLLSAFFEFFINVFVFIQKKNKKEKS